MSKSIATITCLTVMLLALLASCASSEQPDSEAAGDPSDFQVVDATALTLQPVTEDLQDPWGMDFLSSDQLLVTEQGGRLLLVDLANGSQQEISGVPASERAGQGGLLDVLVEHSEDTVMVYLSYSIAGDGGYTTRVARGRLQGTTLVDLEVLFTAQPFYDTKRHFGSRLLIADGYLYATVGDRAQRKFAQDLTTHNGTVIRLHPDGRVPAGNPFVDRSGARPEIWTYGHRNPQGMARHPDGSIWVSEHGPQGGDELNRLQAGANYGWPIITYGEEYGGGKIGEGSARAGMQQPLKYYLPSIATAGIDFYQGDRYNWDPSVLVAGLRFTHLNRVTLEGAGVGAEYRHFGERKLRFRDVQVGPDGYVYVLAGGDTLYRVEPSGSH